MRRPCNQVIAPWKLACAYALDMLIGDPEWFPHPVRLIGRATEAGSRHLQAKRSNSGCEFIEGAALSICVVASSAAAAQAISKLNSGFEILLAWTSLATRSLIDEAGSVLDALDSGDIELARRRISRIVGRDTDQLSESEIVRAVIETAAESTCDGIVAPLLYLTLGGVPAALAYKAVNTLDSMIGHREAPYTYFGRFAARLDDVCNYLPARVAASSIVLAASLTGHDETSAIRVWRQDGNHHASPNSGQMEAAMAGALGVRLGGVNYYDGKPSHGQVIHETGATPGRREGRAALRIVSVASALVFGAAFALAFWNESRDKARG
jgi:adenosylcobinamide-phosphate synthase